MKELRDFVDMADPDVVQSLLDGTLDPAEANQASIQQAFNNGSGVTAMHAGVSNSSYSIGPFGDICACVAVPSVPKERSKLCKWQRVQEPIK